MTKLIKAIGRGNHEYAAIDMRKNRFWMILDHCFCDDDPYGHACDFCLCERGNKGVGYTDEQVLEIINKGND